MLTVTVVCHPPNPGTPTDPQTSAASSSPLPLSPLLTTVTSLWKWPSRGPARGKSRRGKVSELGCQKRIGGMSRHPSETVALRWTVVFVCLSAKLPRVSENKKWSNTAFINTPPMTVPQSNTEEGLVDESVSSRCQEGCNAMYHKQHNHQRVNHSFFFRSNSGVARRKTRPHTHALPVASFRKARPGKAELVGLDGGWQVISRRNPARTANRDRRDENTHTRAVHGATGSVMMK